MKNSINKIVILWLPVVIWMGVIYFFSSMQTAPVTKVYWSEFLIKKSAHIVEYFTLSALFYRAFIGSGIDKKKSVIFAFLSSVFYAAADEYHQSFTPGREPRLRDVFIDVSAAFLALFYITNYLPNTSGKIQKLAKDLLFLR